MVRFPDIAIRLVADKTTAEWAIKYVQAEGTELAEKSIPVASVPALSSPTFDMDYDYNSYSASQDKTPGRLIISRSGIRFVTDFGHSVLWHIQFEQLEKIEKEDRVVTKNLPGKLQRDSGKDLRVTSMSGETHLLKKVDKRDEAFSQMTGFSNIVWQVLW